MTPPPAKTETAECEVCNRPVWEWPPDRVHVEQLHAQIATLLRERDELREFVRRFDSWFPLALKDTGRLSESDDWDTDYKKMVEARRALYGSEKEGGG